MVVFQVEVLFEQVVQYVYVEGFGFNDWCLYLDFVGCGFICQFFGFLIQFEFQFVWYFFLVYVVFFVILEVEEKMFVVFQKLFIFKEVLCVVLGVILGGCFIGICVLAEVNGWLFCMLYSIFEKVVE